MLDLIVQALIALACTAVTAVVPILLPRVLTEINGSIHDQRVALIVDATTRSAGRIVVSIAGQMAAPGASLKNAIALAAASEVATIKGQVGKTIAKVGASDATLPA
jgi:hypothetical protein